METLSTDPAYNGGLLNVTQVTTEDNTVGSLSDEQRSLIVGTLLGDGAMRCKANALIEINHSAEQRGTLTGSTSNWPHWSALRRSCGMGTVGE